MTDLVKAAKAEIRKGEKAGEPGDAAMHFRIAVEYLKRAAVTVGKPKPPQPKDADR